jgi:peptidyl-prolyl cis-trans isomerase C
MVGNDMSTSKKDFKKYHAKHILVAYQHEADDILRKLAAGSDFGEMARIFSQCSSAGQGGDLGEIPAGRADPDFEEAVFLLKPNELGQKAVRTRFGYHIIFRIL